jgi:hypothetical protein
MAGSDVLPENAKRLAKLDPRKPEELDKKQALEM